jgi:hypothetical protein
VFDDLLRELRKLEQGVRVPVKVAVDEEGYLDRRCQTCRFSFKMLFEDWTSKVSDDTAYCPRCGKRAPSLQWDTPEQGEALQAQGLAHLHAQLGQAIDRDVRQFNAKGLTGAWVTLSLAYQPGAPPIVVPVEAACTMRRKVACEACECRYASVGAAFFCPACGHNSATSLFGGALEQVRATIAALPTVRHAVLQARGVDLAEDTARVMIEDAVENLVTAFQCYAEALYSTLEAAPAARRNVFQTIDEASTLWREACGKSYEDLLTSDDMQSFRRYVQQRHLLAHHDGVVDERYVTRSGDHAYELGQRIVVREVDVLEFADILQTLAQELSRQRSIER